MNENLAFVDDLTGLWNRRQVNRLLAELDALPQPVALVLMDLDGFKEVNDRLGHAAGDEVLRTVADVLRRTFRSGDVIARHGGDEFLVLLPATGAAEAQRLTGEARLAVERDTAAVGRVSISAGLASAPEDAARGEDVLLVADARLYVEKRRKRPRPRPQAGRLAAAGLLLIALTAWITNRLSAPAPEQPAQAEAKRTGVAVLGFKNLSGSRDTEWLSTAFAEMLSHELAAAERLRVVPGESVARSRVDLALPVADSLAPDTLSRVRTLLDTDLVVLGSFLEVKENDASRIRLNVRVQDTHRGETVGVVSEDGSARDLVGLVARTAAALRRKLGASPPARDAIATAQAAWPVSLDASRLYAEGLERMRAFDALGARDRFREAVRIEPDSPLVHAALGEAWGLLGYDANARQEAERAFLLSKRLSREERLLVEGRFREAAREWDRAIDTYSTLFQFAPDNVEYGLALARAQRNAGRLVESRATLARLRRLPAPTSDDPRIDLLTAEASNDHRETVAASRNAIRKARARGARLFVARARLIEAFALGELAEYEAATAAAKEAEQIYGQAGDRGGLARAINRLATVRPQQLDPAQTRLLYAQALGIAREIGDRRWTAQVLNNMALTWSNTGDMARARPMYQEALSIFREIGFRRGQANVLLNMGRDLNSEGRSREARKMLQDSLQIWRDLGERASVTYALNNLGNTAQNLGELEEAARLYGESLPIARDVGDRRITAYTLYDLGEIHYLEGKLADARRRHQKGLALRDAIGVRIDAAESRLALARVALMEGDAPRAEAEARPLIAFFSAQKTVQNEVWARAVTAHAQHLQRKREAQATLAPALDVLPSLQHGPIRLAAQTVHGRLLAGAGKTAESIRILEAVTREAAKLGLRYEELEARLAIAESHLAAGDTARARTLTATVARDAAARRFGVVASRAERLAAR